ncbi:MAG TPA: GNAT family N-acetyltransferase [Methanobacterium sp.]|nr:GNAT family N-acetyltransferase [Methanobacterium sp.]
MIIKCEKYILRNWKYSDLENLVKNANNSNIACNMRDGFPNPYTVEDGKKWIKFAGLSDAIFAITVNDKAIGSIGLNIGTDIERISAEVGYWLGEEYWGNGIVSSALKGIVEYGFKELKLERIYAVPLEHNIASRRVLEKNGFILEGILRKSVIKSGKIYNQALYAIIKE